jgi:hypothetical protein
MSRPLAIAPRIGLVCLGVWLVLTVPATRPALANGAFPESYQLVLPADRPGEILLGTNFGLIISEDGGATWTWTCEQRATVMGSLYTVSAPPLDRLFSLSTLVGLAWSDDGSCTWTSSGGTLDTFLATDYFADPSNAMRVYAAGKNPTDDTVPPAIFASDDGGKTFGPALYTAAAGLTLTGVENARSDPQTLYVAAYVTSGFHPRLERSTDGGAHWTELDLEPAIGPNNFRIVAVDPNDPRVISIRVIEPKDDVFAVSRDGGMTFTKMFTIAGQLTAYVRLDSGTILVAGALATEGVGYRSMDGGMTFQDWTPRTTSDGGVPDLASDGGAPRPPHIRALAARGNTLWAAAKNYSDDWAVGVSTDEGVTFARVTQYDQVTAIRDCAQTACLDSCKAQAKAMTWPLAVCGAVTQPPPPPPKGSGSGCALAAGGGSMPPAPTLAALCIVGALALARALRRRR